MQDIRQFPAKDGEELNYVRRAWFSRHNPRRDPVAAFLDGGRHGYDKSNVPAQAANTFFSLEK